MSPKKKDRKANRGSIPDTSDERLFLCIVSGDEKDGEDDRRVTFQVFVPARRVEEVPPLLEKHLKRLRREGKILSGDCALTLYLDHIFEFTGHVKAPLMINYLQTKAVGNCVELGSFAPEDSQGAIESYEWAPEGSPPSDDEDQKIEPFLEFKSANGKTTRELTVDPVASVTMRIRTKLSSCGWLDSSKTSTLKLKLDRETISLELSRSESTLKNAFDIGITHKQRNGKFPPLKYLVEYGDRLDRVLECLADLSRDIEDSNIREHLRQLHRASSEILVYGEKGPIGLRALGERF